MAKPNRSRNVKRTPALKVPNKLTAKERKSPELKAMRAAGAARAGDHDVK